MEQYARIIFDYLKSAGAVSAIVTTILTFILYVFGYLSLYITLTVFGANVDLFIIDDRYLFEGIRFFIFIFSLLPMIVFLVIVIFGIYSIAKFIIRKITSFFEMDFPKIRKLKYKIKLFISNILNKQLYICTLALIVSTLIIQIIMRKAFGIDNIFFKNNNNDSIYYKIMTDELYAIFYFIFLLISIFAVGIVVFSYAFRKYDDVISRSIAYVLTGMFIIQCLLLPINYGALVATQRDLPRVASLQRDKQLPPQEQAWLLWDGPAHITYLVRREKSHKHHCAIISISKENVDMVEIIGYDDLIENSPIFADICNDAHRRRGE